MEQRLYNVPTIRSYEQALAYWTKAKRWEYAPAHNARKIDKRGSRYKYVKLADNEDIHFRYHATNVVTYHKDGNVSLVPWSSMSTTSFAAALLPDGLEPYFHNPIGVMLGCRQADGSQHWWKLTDGGRSTLVRGDDGAWTPTTNTELIDVPWLDHTLLGAALRRWRVADFKAWLDARLAVRAEVKDHNLRGQGEVIHTNSDWGCQALLVALGDQATWPAILASPHLRPKPARNCWSPIKSHATTIMEGVRLAVYQSEKVLRLTQKEYVDSWADVLAASKAQTRWSTDYLTLT